MPSFNLIKKDEKPINYFAHSHFKYETKGATFVKIVVQFPTLLRLQFQFLLRPYSLGSAIPPHQLVPSFVFLDSIFLDFVASPN